MIVRIYETGNLDLMTVGDMLWNADKQANFHPHASWIHSSKFETGKLILQDSTDAESPPVARQYSEFAVKWIGREAVIMWLASNQILFEIVSYAILQDEEDAIENSLDRDEFPPNHLN